MQKDIFQIYIPIGYLKNIINVNTLLHKIIYMIWNLEKITVLNKMLIKMSISIYVSGNNPKYAITNMSPNQDGYFQLVKKWGY